MRFFAAIACLLLAAVETAAAADVMAVTTLPRGTVLSGSDIEIYPAPEEDPFAVRDSYVGMELRRTVYAGSEITPAHLRQPLLVQRNRSVTMTYQFGSLTIVTNGRAMGEGSMGDLVEVMNMESKKKVQAVVTGPDQVTVQ